MGKAKRNRTWNGIMAILLILMLALTACSKQAPKQDEGSKSEQDSNQSQDQNSEQNSSQNQEAESDEEKKEEGNIFEEWSWPLPEKKELSFWITWSNEWVEKPDDLDAIQKIEKNTNVHVNWSVVSSAEAQEKFGLMMASGEYPDIISGGSSYYNGGSAKMVDDGVTLDLTDLIPKYMPLYQSLRTSIPDLEKATKTDDGRLKSIYTLASRFGVISGERPWAGLVVRGDWLKEFGMSAPVTIDDWYSYLKAAKENHPECDAVLPIANDGVDNLHSFLSAYGCLQEFYTPDGVTVKYGVLEEGYRQYLELFTKWYAEGLIDQNFVSNTGFVASNDYLGTGRSAAGVTLWGYTADVLKGMGYNSEEDFYLQAVTQPVLNAGDPEYLGMRMGELTKQELVISAGCQDVELAMRWLDYWYTEEAMLTDSLGVEGESWYKDDAGEYQFAQELHEQVANGTYPNLSIAVYAHTLETADFGLYNWGMFDIIYRGNPAVEAYDIWESGTYDLALPATLSRTDEENVTYTSLYTAIKTAVDEYTVKIIMGSESLDNYDTFIQSLYDFGIEDCIAVQQAALDRYNDR